MNQSGDLYYHKLTNQAHGITIIHEFGENHVGFRLGMDLRTFCSESTAHGLRKIVAAKSRARRIFWLIVFTVAVVSLMIHLYLRYCQKHFYSAGDCTYYFQSHRSRVTSSKIIVCPLWCVTSHSCGTWFDLFQHKKASPRMNETSHARSSQPQSLSQLLSFHDSRFSLRLNLYLKYRHHEITYMLYESSVEYPDVTVCNINPVTSSSQGANQQLR